MPAATAILLALLPIGEASDWHLPPLLPGRDLALEVRAGSPPSRSVHELRYHALWEVELTVEAHAPGVGLFLEIVAADGRPLAADRENEGNDHVAATLRLAPGARVRVRVGNTAAEESGTAELTAAESPDLAAAVAGWIAAAPPSSLEPQTARIRARKLIDDGARAENDGRFTDAEALNLAAIALLEAQGPLAAPDLALAHGYVAMVRYRRHDGSFTPAELMTAIDRIERFLPAGHRDLARLHLGLAGVLAEMGDLEGSLRQRQVATARIERVFGADDPETAMARCRLATALLDEGRLGEARDLAQYALQRLERGAPARGGLELLARNDARTTLMRVALQYGDMAGALLLMEESLAETSASLPANHRRVLGDRLRYSSLVANAGRLEEARAEQAAVLALLEADAAPQRDLLQEARYNLASTEGRLGRFDESRRLLEALLADEERSPANEQAVVLARLFLPTTLAQTGDVAEARHRAEAAVAEFALTASPGEEALRVARLNLVLLALLAGDSAALAMRVRELARELDAALASRPPLAWREVDEVADGWEKPLGAVLSCAAPDDLPLRTWCFDWIESLREIAGGGGLAPTTDADLELAAARSGVRQARVALDQLVARQRRDATAGAGATTALQRAVRERDGAEQELGELLGRRGRRAVPIRLADVAAALPADAAAVGFRRYLRIAVSVAGATPWRIDDHLLCHVVRPDGTLQRVEFGAVEPLQAAARRWRDAVLRPSNGGDPAALAAAGRELHDRLLAPLLAACAGARTLYVCSDDLLQTVPLDALPLADGTRIGERFRCRFLPSFAALVARRPAMTGEPSLLAVGAIDYGAPAAGGARFAPLPATRPELEQIARLFRATFGAAADPAATVLTGAEATAGQLAELAPTKRFVHLATHGWMDAATPPAGGIVRGGELPFAGDFAARVRGLAPMTLCGLALAGANRDGAAGGARMTAEELAALDLSACELVVLSACDTYAGVDAERGGRALKSLQTALHAAGARASLTSLWPVSDLATAELMQEFYGAVWRDRLGKAAALWQAKQLLEKAGEPPASWAGWMLVGDPD